MAAYKTESKALDELLSILKNCDNLKSNYNYNFRNNAKIHPFKDFLHQDIGHAHYFKKKNNPKSIDARAISQTRLKKAEPILRDQSSTKLLSRKSLYNEKKSYKSITNRNELKRTKNAKSVQRIVDGSKNRESMQNLRFHAQ